MPAALNLLNQKFGKLTVVSRLPDKGKYGQIRWLCLCECGNSVAWGGGSLVYASKKVDYPLTCGCRRQDKRSTETYLNSKYNSYKQNAKRRSLTFALTKEQFYFLTQQNCYWCGIKPKLPSDECKWTLSKGIPIAASGIDRFDNQFGYESTNCVPCCEQCNRIKRDLSGQDFLNLINAYYKKHFCK